MSDGIIYDTPKSNKNTLETEFPLIAEEFKKIQKEQYELFSRKMVSYGKGNISMGTELKTQEEVKFSLTSIWIRLHDKMNRLKNLVVFGKTNTVEDESIEDTYKDISNYAIISLIVKRGLWK